VKGRGAGTVGSRRLRGHMEYHDTETARSCRCVVANQPGTICQSMCAPRRCRRRRSERFGREHDPSTLEAVSSCTLSVWLLFHPPSSPLGAAGNVDPYTWTKANAEDRVHTCAVLPASTCSSLQRDWKCYGHIFFRVNTEMTTGLVEYPRDIPRRLETSRRAAKPACTFCCVRACLIC
jgi:hypothetical protein